MLSHTACLDQANPHRCKSHPSAVRDLIKQLPHCGSFDRHCTCARVYTPVLVYEPVDRHGTCADFTHLGGPTASGPTATWLRCQSSHLNPSLEFQLLLPLQSHIPHLRKVCFSVTVIGKSLWNSSCACQGRSERKRAQDFVDIHSHRASNPCRT
jgi:hypothetical protein